MNPEVWRKLRRLPGASRVNGRDGSDDPNISAVRLGSRCHSRPVTGRCGRELAIGSCETTPETTFGVNSEG